MPRKVLRTCTSPGCPQLQPCTTHGRKPWDGSARRQHVASGWQQQRDNERILRRHRYVCHICNQFGAMQVDHVVPLAEGGADTDDNKRPIHSVPCHEQKTRAEAARARSRRG